MASSVIITMTDDIDGSEGAKTVKFSLGDKSYTIDLGEANEAALATALAPFIGHAKVVPQSKSKSRSPRSTSRSIEIREWARNQGMKVPERGRISQSITDAYDAAHTAPRVPVEPALAFEPAPAALV